MNVQRESKDASQIPVWDRKKPDSALDRMKRLSEIEKIIRANNNESKFKDQVSEKEVEVLCKKIKDETNAEDLYKLAKQLFPTWIVRESAQASVDLILLNKSWAGLCAKLKVFPQRILLVEDTMARIRETGQATKGNEEQHKLLFALCDGLTKLGFCVRDSWQFEECGKCKELIV